MNNIEAPPLRNVSHSEIVDFLIAHGVNAACSECGYPDSAIHLRKGDIATIAAMSGINIDDASGKAAVNLNAGSLVVINECERCGHYRTFGLKKILDWLDARRNNNGGR